MLFHSFQFAIFFPVVFGLYLALPHKWQNRMLLAASYIFYGAWDWRYCSLLVVSTVVDYWCGRGLSATEDKRRRKQFVALSVTVNLTLLGIFKYFDFFAISFQQLMGQFGLVVHPYMLDVALPIGISFYTFQTMSYTIDVYRKKLDATDDILDFALYVAFFPQLIAGPIERGMRLLPQILKPRTVTREKFYKGIYFFGWGLFLKVFVADNLAAIVDPVFAAGATHQGIFVVLGTYAFAIQIYADFAGYSFMAIGMALAMGIELMENFRRPYFSRNIGEFWRRWHISLSSWFRDYMFSPFYLYCEKQPLLSRLKLKIRHGIAFFAALLATEFLLGLWHGAAWTFAMFGVYHALAIWAYYMVRRKWDRMNGFVQIFLTFQVACIGWLIFRAYSMEHAWDMFASLFTNFGSLRDPAALDAALGLAGYSAVLLGIQIFQDWKKDTLVVLSWPRPVRYAVFALLLSLVMVFGQFGNRPFIYFQF